MLNKNWTLLAMLLFISIGVRILFFVDTARTPAQKSFQESLYNEKVREMSQAEKAGGPSELSGLYTRYLSLLTRVVPETPVPRILSNILGILLVIIAFSVGTTLYSRPVGFVAGLFTALSGTELFFEGKDLPYSILAVLGALLSLLLLKIRDTGRLIYFFLFGLALAASYMLWIDGWPIVIAGLAAMFLVRRPAAGIRKLGIAVFAAGLVSVCAPFAINNYRNFDEIAVSSTGSGANFFLGNQVNLRGVPFTVRQSDFAAMGQRARWESNKSLKEYQVSRFWYGQTFREMARRPARQLWLLLSKVRLFAGSYEIPQDESLYFSMARRAPLLKYTPFLSVLIMPLFLVGLFADMRNVVRNLPVFFPVIAALVVNMLFLTSSGERLFAILSFSVLAGFALVNIAGKGSPLRRRGILLAGTVVAGIALILPSQALRKLGEDASRQSFLLGMSSATTGNAQQATSYFEKALFEDRTNIDARLGMASLFIGDGIFEQARTQYFKVMAADSNEALAYLGLGVTFQLTKDPARAAYYCAKAIEKSPWLADGHNALGTCLYNQGYYQDALEHFRTAVFLKPDHTEAINNISALRQAGFELPETGGNGADLAEMTAKQIVGLAMEDARKGMFVEARKKLQTAAKREPESPEVVYGFATVSLQEGKLDEAIAGYRTLLDKAPSNLLVLNNLAAAYARKGELSQAVVLWEKIAALNPSNELVRRNLERAKAELRSRKK